MIASVSATTTRKSSLINTNKPKNENNKHDDVFQATTSSASRTRTNRLSLITKGIFIMGTAYVISRTDALLAQNTTLTVTDGRYAFGPEGCHIGSAGICIDFTITGFVYDPKLNVTYDNQMSSLVIFRAVNLSPPNECFPNRANVVRPAVNNAIAKIEKLINNKSCYEMHHMEENGKMSILMDGVAPEVCKEVLDESMQFYTNCKNNQESTKKGLTGGAIAGIVIALVGATSAAVYFRKNISNGYSRAKNYLSHCFFRNTEPSVNTPLTLDRSERAY